MIFVTVTVTVIILQLEMLHSRRSQIDVHLFGAIYRTVGYCHTGALGAMASWSEHAIPSDFIWIKFLWFHVIDEKTKLIWIVTIFYSYLFRLELGFGLILELAYIILKLVRLVSQLQIHLLQTSILILSMMKNRLYSTPTISKKNIGDNKKYWQFFLYFTMFIYNNKTI